MKFLSASRLILFGYAALTTFVATSFFLFLDNAQRIQADYQNLVYSQNNASHIRQMQIHAKNRSILLSQILLETDEFIQDELIQTFYIEGNRFGAQRALLFSSDLNSEQLAILNRLNQLIEKNSVRQNSVIDLILEGKLIETRSAYLETLPYQADIMASLSNLSSDLAQNAIDAQQGYQSLVIQDENLTNTLNISLLLAMFILGFYSFRQSKQIEQKTNQNFKTLNTQMTEQLHVNAMDAHILHAVEESIVLTSREGEIVRCNPSFETFRSQLDPNKQESIWQLLQRVSDQEFSQNNICKYVESSGAWHQEIMLGAPFNFIGLCEITKFKPTDLIEANLLVSIKDISELKKAQKAIEIQANFDAITELPNRHYFQNKLSEVTKSTHIQFALLYIDLDDFKNINDSLGHNYGDALLNAVSFRMNNLLLELCKDHYHLARIGGDEFAIVLTTDTDDLIKASESLSARLIKTISQSYQINDEKIEIGCSIGISYFPEQSQTATQIMRNADLAMYEAKHNGKNGYALYSESIKQRLEQRIILQQRIESAIQNEEFSLHYQPLFDLQNKEIIGLEALIRWDNEEVNYQPDEFIPFAEENRLIQQIDEYIIQKACQQIDLWQQQGFQVPRVAINISSKQPQPENLVTLISSQLEKYGFEGSHIELEVTEYSLISGFEKQHEEETWFNTLHNKGIHISIDDFGTGYSSLSYLQHLRVNRLKIDKSFIAQMESDNESLMITESIIQLAHNVGASVLAEGVETQSQAERLLELGCDEAQGYLFKPPLPVEEVAKLLRR